MTIIERIAEGMENIKNEIYRKRERERKSEKDTADEI